MRDLEAARSDASLSSGGGVGFLLANMQEFVDVVVPRGGRSLIERVMKDARIPVIGHLEGIGSDATCFGRGFDELGQLAVG